MITVVFDTETTGLLKPSANSLDQQPYIIEIHCTKFDTGKTPLLMLSEFSTLVKPPVPVTDEITKITGISNSMLEDQPSFVDIWEELAEFFKGVDRVVAHNLAFDRSMLANELMRLGKVLYFPWPMSHICTVEKTLHIEQRRMNLSRLHEYLFEEGFKDAHRAKSDVDALTRCYLELLKRGLV